MSEWQQLIQQGILGTSRQPTVPALPPTIAVQATPSKDDSGTTVAALDVETRFLQQAAILAHYEAVGLLPHALDEAHGLCETATAPPETNAAVSERAALLLQQLLADFDLKLVVEWVRHAARRRAYLPHEFLPTLLDYATKHQPLATALTPILGERGRWLIALNPAWQNSANEELHRDDWQQGSTNARVAYLEEQRRQAPTQARDALMAVWTQEAAAERAAFVGTLRINLSDGDRPFLEEAYTDRSINVRIIVTRLLAQLPNAALHRALLSELTNHLQIERKWLKRQLTVTLPKYFREQWHEWGIREQSPLGVRIGSKMGWLVQLIALVPPSTLVNALAVDAVDLLNLVRASEHAEPLLTALLEGAEQHQDFAFLLAELHHLLRLLKLAQIQQGEFIERFARYAPLLPAAERLPLVEEYLTITRQRAFGDWTTLQMTVRHCDALSPAITHHLMAEQLPTLLARDTRDYGVGRILLDLAYQLAPEGYTEAAKLFRARSGEERPEYIDRFLQIYALRQQMAAAFA